jgi:hypothetical protein
MRVCCRELGSDWEATRLEALRWIASLLERHRTEVSIKAFLGIFSLYKYEYYP